MSGLEHQVVSLLEQYGPVALFFTIMLETFGLPLPGESILIAASTAAGAGKMSIWHVALAAFAGGVVGDNVGYLIGRRYGKPVILQYGGRFGLTDENFAKVEGVAERYGPLMVVAARFFVILRQLNGLVAGSTGMHWAVFLAANALGAALWVGFWTTLAYKFGHDLSILPYIWHHLSRFAMVLIPLLLCIIAVLYWKLRPHKFR